MRNPGMQYSKQGQHYTCEIHGIQCRRSLPNYGSFGRTLLEIYLQTTVIPFASLTFHCFFVVYLCLEAYDAQIANVKLETDSTSRTYGLLTKRSRIAIFADSPHSGGNAVSYSLSFETKGKSEMILVHYGGTSSKSGKDIFTLTLNNGIPILYRSRASRFKPVFQYHLNDGKWHHVAVSMSENSCKLSDVIMYIDGKRADTTATSDDDYLFFMNSGRISIGGFGYTSERYESEFPHLSPFFGKIDEFQMWGRSIVQSNGTLLY
jgi:hypothetical protein